MTSSNPLTTKSRSPVALEMARFPFASDGHVGWSECGLVPAYGGIPPWFCENTVNFRIEKSHVMSIPPPGRKKPTSEIENIADTRGIPHIIDLEGQPRISITECQFQSPNSSSPGASPLPGPCAPSDITTESSQPHQPHLPAPSPPPQSPTPKTPPNHAS